MSDTCTIVFSDPISDPIFYLIDLQGVGGRVTLTAGATTFTNNADGVWSGNVFTATNGFPAGGSASGAVQYQGMFAAGSTFTFDFDSSGVGSALQTDTIGLAIGAPVPEPGTAAAVGLACIALAGWRRVRPGRALA